MWRKSRYIFFEFSIFHNISTIYKNDYNSIETVRDIISCEIHKYWNYLSSGLQVSQ